MKKDIHPKYIENAVITCACGNKYTIGSTIPEIHVEVCSKCHPYWTGDEKFVDIEGRVDKFKRKKETADKLRSSKIQKLKEKIAKEQERENAPRTLKDILKSYN